MANTETPQSFSFELKNIQLVNKSMVFSPLKGKEQEFAFDISLQSSVIESEQQNIHFLSVDISTKSDKKNVGSVSIACTFTIGNFDHIVIRKDDQIQLPSDLLYLLNTVVVGTMRGIMYSEFRGTNLQNAILPVLDPRSFQNVDK